MRRVALIALAAALIAPAATAAHPSKHKRAATAAHGSKHRPVRRDERVRLPAHPAVDPSPAGPPSTTPPGPPPAPKPKPLARLQVLAREFSLTLSRRTLPAGRVAIELDNFGQDPHDLRVERETDASSGFSFTLAGPGTVSSRKLELAAGTWKLYCTLPGHEALGMKALLTVGG